MGAPELAEEELVDFLRLIYADEAGYSYVATKTLINPDKKIQDVKWNQHFFQWPEEQEQLVDFIAKNSGSLEVYYSPALFSRAEATKEAVQASRVFWCEFDGTLPKELNGLPEPSIRVVSSVEGHEHWYWRVDSAISTEQIEAVNRKVAYALGADTSGWDASQVLRPVGTYNHKRKAPVRLKESSENTVAQPDFSELPEPPPLPTIPVPDSIPAIEDVVPKYKFEEPVWDLFKNGSKDSDRSDGLMSLGYYLAEMQLPDKEIFALLVNADERWGKFAGRRDQYKRLMEIVVRARVKYPLQPLTASEYPIELEGYGLLSLLNLEEEVEWVWEGLLHTTGYMLVTGASGVGKTQFSLNTAAQLILGKKHLGRETQTENIKIGFFSLEMGTVELKHFLSLQSQAYTEEELDILEQQLRLYPLGEPIYLTDDKEKARIEKLILEEGLTGVMFDSLGSVTSSSLSNEENIKNLMDWNDRLRKQLKIFTWYIHHHRKASGENKKPNKLSDVYGSQYITARTSTVLCLWDIGVTNTVQCIPLKTRFTTKPQPFNLYRDKLLNFYQKVTGITLVEEGESESEVAEMQPSAHNKLDAPPAEGTKGF